MKKKFKIILVRYNKKKEMVATRIYRSETINNKWKLITSFLKYNNSNGYRIVNIRKCNSKTKLSLIIKDGQIKFGDYKML